jgi:ketosteroid isomerase-like protein
VGGVNVREYYALLDAGRVDDAVRFFTEDASVRIANSMPIAGREAIGKVLGGALRGFAGIRHDVRSVWEPDAATLIYEVDVTYYRKDGSTVSITGACVCQMRDGACAAQRIYADLSPALERSS